MFNLFGSNSPQLAALSSKTVDQETVHTDAPQLAAGRFTYLNEKGHKIPSVLEVLSWEVIANMIKEGLGVGILPDYVAKGTI